MASIDRIVEFPVIQAEFGVTPDRAKNLRRTGQWREGLHWRKVSRKKILYNHSAILVWFHDCFNAGIVPATITGSYRIGSAKHGNNKK